MKIASFLLSFALISVTQGTAFAISKGIIGDDSRVLSHDPKVGRLHDSSGDAGCTGTLISQSCAVTAGHCISTLYTIQFNTPENSFRGPVGSHSRDTYTIDRKTIARENRPATDEDWAVFQIQKHKPVSKLERWFASHFQKNSKIENYPMSEGYYPGAIQGFYEISAAPNSPGEEITITGYGSDTNLKMDRTQRSAEGKLLNISLRLSPFALLYDVDTTSGTSGSALINKKTGKIIGVHNAFLRSYNMGTSINLATRFQDAINDCLRRENSN